MAYLGSVSARTQRDPAGIYRRMKAGESDAALKCYRGFKSAMLSLEEQPDQCPVPPENNMLRHLLYGNKPHIYRAVYRVSEKQKVVKVLHVRHGARTGFNASDVA